MVKISQIFSVVSRQSCWRHSSGNDAARSIGCAEAGCRVDRCSIGTRTGDQRNRSILKSEGSGVRLISIKKDITYGPLLPRWNRKIICLCDAAGKSGITTNSSIWGIDNININPLDPHSRLIPNSLILCCSGCWVKSVGVKHSGPRPHG